MAGLVSSRQRARILRHAHYIDRLPPAYVRILRRTTRGFGYDPSTWSGSAGIAWFLAVFRSVRLQLVDGGATQVDLDAYRDAILAAIYAAPDCDLSTDERVALRRVLLIALDDQPRRYNSAVTPKLRFLRYVTFQAEAR